MSDPDIPSNGHSELRRYQSQKFKELEDVITDGFEKSSAIMREGFQLIASELRVTRDQGVVPIPLLTEILNSNNAAYKEMITSNNRTYSGIITKICAVIGALIAWATGVKFWGHQ